MRLRREVDAVAGGRFDLVVVGGGAFGAWAAYDAAQRGLSVALLERGDFGAGTSAHALRLMHAQPGSSVRGAAAGRAEMLRLAPHLVSPCPLLTPCYNAGGFAHTLKATRLAGRALLATGTGRGLHDPARCLPRDGMLGVSRLIGLFPDLSRRGLAGAQRVARVQVTAPERLVLAVVQAAAARGARVLNHAEVDGLIREDGRVLGVTVVDRHAGRSFEVRGRMVLNATGPEAHDLLLHGGEPIEMAPVACHTEMALVIHRRLVPRGWALALPAACGPESPVAASLGDEGTVLGPWILGPTGEGTPLGSTIDDCLAQANRAYPAWRLQQSDVGWVSVARVPDVARAGSAVRITDHAEDHGVHNLMTLVGVDYTAARPQAAAAVDRVMARLGGARVACRTADVPLAGGDLVDLAAAADELKSIAGGQLPAPVLSGLLMRHGAHAAALLQGAVAGEGGARLIDGSTTLVAELEHAVREESALTLGDVVLRRSGLAATAEPGEAVLARAVGCVAAAAGWSDAVRDRQTLALRAELAARGAAGDADPPASVDRATDHAA